MTTTQGNNENVGYTKLTRTTLRNVRVSDLSMILTNTHVIFDNIALDIKDAIDTFDADKVC